MPEIRKDYILDRWVIFAPERKIRPFLLKKSEEKENTAKCPFCPGNEWMTPPTIYQVGEPWKIRLVENKFPALNPDITLKHKKKLSSSMSGYGHHEVIIETNKHNETFCNLSPSQMRSVIETYIKRLKILRKEPNIKYVLIFKNSGEDAGTSISHTHSQLLALPVIPALIEDEIKKSREFYRKNKKCIFCEIIKKERKSERFLTENKDFFAIAPYASVWPGEVWILTKRHISDITSLNKREIENLSKMLLTILKSISKIFGNPDYNYALHCVGNYNNFSSHTTKLTLKKSISCIAEESPFYHFHIEVQPRLSKMGGAEVGGGIFINTVMPETFAMKFKETKYD